MILLLEIYLTYKAWVRGWKGRALVPWAIMLPVAFAIGWTAGTGGMDENALFGVTLMLDVALVVILAVMAVKGRQTLPHESHDETPEPLVGVPAVGGSVGS